MYFFSSALWRKVLFLGIGSLFLWSGSPVWAMEDEGDGPRQRHLRPQASKEDVVDKKNDIQARTFLQNGKARASSLPKERRIYDEASIADYQRALMLAKDPDLKAEALLELARVRGGLVGELHYETVLRTAHDPVLLAQAHKEYLALIQVRTTLSRNVGAHNNRNSRQVCGETKR